MSDEPAAAASRDAPGDLQSIRAETARQKKRSGDVQAAAQRGADQQEADDRSHITRTVMGVLRWGLPAAIAMLLLLALLEPSSASDAVKAVVEIFKAVLLPVMTLVLGYYFGRGGKV